MEQPEAQKSEGVLAAMYRLVLAVVAALCLHSATRDARAASFGTNYAIVVGIDNYDGQWPALRYAVADARRVTGFLESQGYTVTLLLDGDATRESILDAFRQAALTLGENDRFLFYFGGHGHTDRLGNAEHGYLVPHGASGIGGMVGMEEVRTMSGLMSNVRHQLFVLNSCYGGTIGTLRGATSLVARDRPDYLDQITQRQARQFMAAGGPEQQVLDGGPGGLSWFTHYFLEAVQDGAADLDGDRIVTFPEMQAYLLPRASNATQTPTSGALPGHAFGEYIFDASIKQPAGQALGLMTVPSPPPQPPAPEVAQLRDIAVDFDAMQQPIHRLYAAWEALDIDAYAAQWSPSAVQLVGAKKRSFADIVQRRARLFPKLAGVEVERYQVWFRGFEDDIASFDASYDMAFYFKDGRVVRESERETYATRKIDGRWLIIENRDYLR
nr:putative xylanase/chitin deacetylase [uncultured bacterium]